MVHLLLTTLHVLIERFRFALLRLSQVYKIACDKFLRIDRAQPTTFHSMYTKFIGVSLDSKMINLYFEQRTKTEPNASVAKALSPLAHERKN